MIIKIGITNYKLQITITNKNWNWKYKNLKYKI